MKVKRDTHSTVPESRVLHLLRLKYLLTMVLASVGRDSVDSGQLPVPFALKDSDCFEVFERFSQIFMYYGHIRDNGLS